MPQTRHQYLGSLRFFKNWEPFVHQIVEQWPSLTLFEPKNVTIATMTTRLRIAINSLKKNPTWVTEVNMAKFMSIAEEIAISPTYKEGFITCGPREKLRDAIHERLSHDRKLEVAKMVQQDEPSVHDVVVQSPNVMTIPSMSGQATTNGIRLVNPTDELIRAVILFHHHQLLLEPSVIISESPVAIMAQGYDVGVSREGDEYTLL